jgi:hypothetical protein
MTRHRLVAVATLVLATLGVATACSGGGDSSARLTRHQVGLITQQAQSELPAGQGKTKPNSDYDSVTEALIDAGYVPVTLERGSGDIKPVVTFEHKGHGKPTPEFPDATRTLAHNIPKGTALADVTDLELSEQFTVHGDDKGGVDSYSCTLLKGSGVTADALKQLPAIMKTRQPGASSSVDIPGVYHGFDRGTRQPADVPVVTKLDCSS